MEPKSLSKSGNLLRYLALGGMGLAMLGASYFLWRKSQKNKSSTTQIVAKKSSNISAIISLITESSTVSEELPKELVLKILTKLREALFPIVSQTVNIFEKAKSRAGSDFHPEELKLRLMTLNQSEVKSIQLAVVAQYGVKDPDFSDACKVVYKDDMDVKLKRALILKDLEEAAYGRFHLAKARPGFLTSQRTLEILIEQIKAGLRQANKTIQDLAQKGVEFSPENPIFNIVLKNMLAREIRVQVLEKEGLSGFEDHPELLFAHARAEFLKSDNELKTKEAKIGTRFMETIQKILQQDKDIQKIIEEFGDDILESCYISIKDIPSDKI